MKRCVASRSCGEIFTFISLSDSLKMEKSWGLRPRWGTRSFFRLSAVGRGWRLTTEAHLAHIEAGKQRGGQTMLGNTWEAKHAAAFRTRLGLICLQHKMFLNIGPAPLHHPCLGKDGSLLCPFPTHTSACLWAPTLAPATAVAAPGH